VIDKGADVNTKDNFRKAILLSADIEGSDTMTKPLIDGGSSGSRERRKHKRRFEAYLGNS